MFEPMVKLIPQGSQGVAKVRHITITPQVAQTMVLRELITHGRERSSPAGEYCQLIVDGELMMSDTQLEHDTNQTVVRKASGDVLIAGLGIGLILVPILAKASVNSVTVVELHQDVIDLVAPNFTDDRLQIICEDIYSWKPAKGTKFQTIYFDIWPNICWSNRNQMVKLERRFRANLDKGGWMNSWAKELCRKWS
jgi:predicted membrane-bound spermidine synthase